MPLAPAWPGTAVMLGLRGAQPERREIRPGDELLLGRDSGCDVVVPDPTVSRRHARVAWRDGELTVEDLGSSGGTYVNGAAAARARLAPGDVLRLGPRSEFLLELLDDTGHLEAPSGALERVAQEGREQGVRQLQVMLEVARALNAATVVGEVLDVVLQAAVQVLGADQGCVALSEPDGQRRVAAVWPRDLNETRWGEKSSILNRAINERRTITVQAVQDRSVSIVSRGFGAAVATPLLVAHRPLGLEQEASFIATLEVIGGLLVEKRSPEAAFLSSELAVFESLAADAAVAIDGARLYRESREKAKIEYEMSLARTIQAALLRQPPPVAFAEIFAHSQAARAVGGDLYHCAVRSDGSLAVAVGDVSGKGVAAALIMAMAQGLLGLIHDLGRPLDELADLLNRNLAKSNPGNRFLTLAVALVRPDGEVRLVNAGHCPVLVRRADGRIESTEVSGPILGILPEGSWPEQRLNLAAGDALVFYTDGIAESQAPGGEELGEEGVRRALLDHPDGTPKLLGQALLDAAAAHRAGREAHDDVTLLVLRYGASGE